MVLDQGLDHLAAERSLPCFVRRKNHGGDGTITAAD
jgi:hypothetical protein